MLNRRLISIDTSVQRLLQDVNNTIAIQRLLQTVNITLNYRQIATIKQPLQRLIDFGKHAIE